MSLIVEDGTGFPDAESYHTLDEADVFWSDRLEQRWIGATVPAKEAASRQAFDYLALAFRWPGQPLLTTQRGVWPRGLAYDYAGVLIPENTVPGQVKTGSILLALEALDKNLLQVATAEPALSSKSVKIGPLTIDRQFDTGRQPRGLPRFPAVDAVLSGIANVRSSGGGGFTSRRIIRG